MAKKLTRKQKSRINKAAFRAKSTKRKAGKARKSYKRKATKARRSVKRTTRRSTARRSVKRTARRSTVRRTTKRKSVRARYRKGSMGERIRTNPGSKVYLNDGTVMAYSKSGRVTYITLNTPYGETYEYETGSSATFKRAMRAKTSKSAQKALGGAMLRHINPGRKSSRGARRSVKRTAKGRFARC